MTYLVKQALYLHANDTFSVKTKSSEIVSHQSVKFKVHDRVHWNVDKFELEALKGRLNVLGKNVKIKTTRFCLRSGQSTLLIEAGKLVLLGPMTVVDSFISGIQQ